MKFFATILFLLEFLSPAFPLGANSFFDQIDQASQINTSNHPGFILGLFADQLNENEEGRATYKSISSNTELDIDFASYHTEYIIKSRLPQIVAPSFRFVLQVPLFKLHHTYLI